MIDEFTDLEHKEIELNVENGRARYWSHGAT